jgi:hypothetical protein
VLHFDLTTISGRDNTIGMPIFLLPLDTENARRVGGAEDVTLQMANVPGLALTVFANSVTCPDGTTECLSMITQVHRDKVPMPPPGGAAPRLVWTVQPPGILFDPPARITYPNIDGLPPGQIVDVFSFDHDLGEFVSIGTGSVSEDGSVITSDPGVGIRKAGWGYPQPPPPPQTCVQNITQVSVRILEAVDTLQLGESGTLLAEGEISQDSADCQDEAGAGTYAWTSSDTTVANNPASRQSTSVIGKAAGTTTLTVTFATGTGQSATASVQVTVVEVEFQTSGGAALASPLRVGITFGTNDRTQNLRAVVTPEEEADNVTLSASSNLSLSNVTRNGNVITFDLVGTARSSNRGDQIITATHTSGLTADHPVSVVVPGQIATPHDVTGGGVVLFNGVFDETTKPSVFNLQPGNVFLATLLARVLTITVLDQFGDTIGGLYQGAKITELLVEPKFRPTNQDLTAASTYSDPVGAFFTPPVSQVPANSPEANAWPSQPHVLPVQPDSGGSNPLVRVDGFLLNPGVVNRTVVITPPSTLTITWP